MTDDAAPSTGPAWKAVGTKKTYVPRSLGAWVMIVALVLAAGAALQWWWTQPERQLGSHGTVTAVVDEDCVRLHIEADGLEFFDHSADEIPSEWDGTNVTGRLVVTEATGESAMTAEFTADDGTVLTVYGGVKGKAFSYLGCAVRG